MGLGICAKIIKYLVFGFNLLFFISGVIIMALGIVLHVKEGGYVTLLPSLPFLNAANISIVAGIIVMFVAFLGCCGAIKENACLLLLYFIFLVLIFILEIVAGILGFVYRNQVEERVTSDLQKGLMLYGEKDEGGLTSGWDRLQQGLLCCGVKGPMDWNTNGTFSPGTTPDSCCVKQEENCGTKLATEKFQSGCSMVLIRDLEASIYYIAAGGIAIGLFQIIGMVFAMILYTSIKRGSSA